jgi:hypothetical protein
MVLLEVVDKMVVVQQIPRKQTSILIELALIIIGYHYWGQFAKEQEDATRRLLFVDVNAIMLENKK